MIDQDPAALAYARDKQLSAFRDSVDVMVCRVVDIPKKLGDRSFDVIVSAGLFDYFDVPSARPMIEFLCSRLSPGGLLAITNYASEDPGSVNRFITDWVLDWPLIYKTGAEMHSMFPDRSDVTLELSQNETLWLARAAIPT